MSFVPLFKATYCPKMEHILIKLFAAELFGCFKPFHAYMYVGFAPIFYLTNCPWYLYKMSKQTSHFRLHVH